MNHPSSIAVDERRFHEEGFVPGYQVLGPETLGRLRVLCDELMNSKDSECRPIDIGSGGHVWKLQRPSASHHTFLEVASDPALAETAAQLIGATQLRLWRDQVQIKPSFVGGETRWHQDGPFWTILSSLKQITAWIALDDATEASGCMRMVIGSHLWDDRSKFLGTIDHLDELPSEYDGRRLSVRKIIARAGEVHFHHALTWHGSGSNRTPFHRRALAIHYITGDTRYKSGEHPMKKYIDVSEGDIIQGEHFPLVFPAPRCESSK
jgi:phytanoyl-CoA hydroxylase